MRTVSQLALALVALSGCGSSQPTHAPHPAGYAARMQDAERHEQLAASHRQSAGTADVAKVPDNYACGDTAMLDQLTSGGQRIVSRVPCWNPAEESAERHRVAAIREDERARHERRAAASLVEAELAACRGVSPEEIDHSPFAHRSSVAEVIPHHIGARLRGVRIVFKRVPSLTQGWMEQAIECHRARFERLGEPPSYLPEDPTLVHGATTTVATHDGHVEVLVETSDDVAAQVALGRARDLVATRTAGR